MAAITRKTFDAVYAVDEAEICNLALSRLGVELMTDTDNDSKQARACKAVYAQCRDKLLRTYPFNFAIRSAFIPEDASPTTPLNGYSYAYKAEDRRSFTASATLGATQLTGVTGINLDDYLLGRSVYGTGIQENAVIVSYDETGETITIDRPTTAIITTGTLSCGISLLSVMSVGANKENIYDTNGGGENARILCDLVSDQDNGTNVLEIKYVKRIINPYEFDSSFVNVLSVMIAMQICLTLTSNGQLFQALQIEFYRLLDEAKKASAKEKQLDFVDPMWTNRNGEETGRR